MIPKMVASDFRFRLSRQYIYLTMLLMAGTAINSPAFAQSSQPDLLVGGGGGGGSGVNGNGGAGGGGGGIGGGGGGSGYGFTGGAGGRIYDSSGDSVGGGGGSSIIACQSSDCTGFQGSLSGPAGSAPAYTNLTGGRGGNGTSSGGSGGIGGGGGGGGDGDGDGTGNNNGGGGGGAASGILGSGGNGGATAAPSPVGGGGAGGAGGTSADLTGEAGSAPPASGGGAGGGGGGGAGGGAGGTGGNIGGYPTPPYAAAGSNGYASGAALATLTLNQAQSYGIIAVGGGGGGGGGGGLTNDIPATDGQAGQQGRLTIGDGASISASMVMIGGSGGGGGGGSNNNMGNNGGAGGAGDVILNGSTALLSITDKLLIGGAGGFMGGTTKGSVADAGGAGGNGTLYIENFGTLSLGNNATVLPPTQEVGSASNGAGIFSLSGTGYVSVAAGDSASIDMNVSDGAGGPGTFTKVGSGTLVMNGSNNSYSGGTTIQAGVLEINESDYKMSTNGPLTLYIAPTSGAGGQLVVKGKVDLTGATINIVALPGTYTANGIYDVISAQQITSQSGLPAPTLLNHLGNSVTLGDQLVDGGSVYQVDVTRGGIISSGSGGLTPAEAAFFAPGRIEVDSLYAQNAALFMALSSPVGTQPDYWTHGLGSFGHMPGDQYNYKGFVVGRGFSVNPHLIIGGAVANLYTHTASMDYSSADNTSVGAELYGIYNRQSLSLTTIATIGHLGNRVTRVLPGMGEGKFATNGVYSGASLAAQYNGLNRGHFFAAPYAGISYLYTTTGSGQETGLSAGLNLHYGRISSSLAQADAGFTAGYRSLAPYGVLTTWAGLGGLGTLGNTHANLAETLDQDITVIEQGHIAPIGAFTPEVGVQLAGQNSQWTLGANWNGQFASHASSQAFTLKGRYKF